MRGFPTTFVSKQRSRDSKTINFPCTMLVFGKENL